MIKSRLAKVVFGSTFLATMLLPAMAFAAEAAVVGEYQSYVAKAIGAGLAMGLSALAAGYAQAKIGAAGAGTLAERPEASVWVVVLQALPEIIVLLGFVAAILIVNMPVTPA
ncbi:MAG: F0F1 ATP synthase subunit C [Coriobacteriia bacterium]|jgi:V/A-type H+-transporting ATPase subunit K|nr:F0F1 ATP synthase subunit C [Coriobacteriia bacterium]